jgi:hypothetical protein
LYGLRVWVEQSYKQVKQHLGWAQYQVRSDRAIRRHWELVCCAFCFCWWTLAFDPAQPVDEAEATPTAPGEGKKRSRGDRSSSTHDPLAGRSAARARLAGAVPAAAPQLAGLIGQTAPAPASGAAGLVVAR